MTQSFPAPQQIRVVYAGVIQQTLNLSEEWIELASPATMRWLLATLAHRYGDPFRDAMFVWEEQVVPNAVLLVDGNDIRHSAGLDTTLTASNWVQILLMPAASGGG